MDTEQCWLADEAVIFAVAAVVLRFAWFVLAAEIMRATLGEQKGDQLYSIGGLNSELVSSKILIEN